MSSHNNSIAFQGAHGAYSDLSCRTVYPARPTLPCNSFEEAFEAVRGKQAELAMIPVDNTIAGRVADVHHLMPGGELFIIGEHFQPVHHALLGVKGTKIEDLTTVHSHVHALPQCRKFIRAQGLKGVVHADTAGAAREIAEKGDKTHAAIASTLAAEIYGLDVLKTDIQDNMNNVTRFVILSREPEIPAYTENQPAHDTITSLIFEARNIPAALYKCLGGFATAGFNLTRLESYVNENFEAARFYMDVEGHPESPHFKLALEELGFYAKDVLFLGAYPAHAFRRG
ncbi:MAG: prephenate dehydratase [Alphaproteobacteria bacterium]|nr:prephenate dehydratase [Alphaproteobacteria bacterium]MCD8519834.1 prephenate dehydratase [Alphaproteobacteria bacterium]MCD8570371.1 prephenate dehydratase [Alphaproteobacteria bacterium]